MKNNDKFHVEVSIEVQDIQDINEVENTFEVPFILLLSWRDSRLQFKNLQHNIGRNLLSDDEKDKKKGIWSPTVVFKNTNEKHESKVDEKTYIKINGYWGTRSHTFAPLSDHENAILYKSF